MTDRLFFRLITVQSEAGNLTPQIQTQPAGVVSVQASADGLRGVSPSLDKQQALVVMMLHMAAYA